MTRHKIDGKNPKHEVFVGWDREHWSFYGEVYNLAFEPEDQRLIFARGPQQRARAYEDLGKLVDALRDYAVFTKDIVETLYDDKEHRQ